MIHIDNIVYYVIELKNTSDCVYDNIFEGEIYSNIKQLINSVKLIKQQNLDQYYTILMLDENFNIVKEIDIKDIIGTVSNNQTNQFLC